MKLYVVMQTKPAGELPDFQGVFSTREKAVSACRDWTYCLFHVELDESLPHESSPTTTTEFPISQ